MKLEQLGTDANKVILGVLDELALTLTEHHHIWTDEQRGNYEKAVALLSK